MSQTISPALCFRVQFDIMIARSPLRSPVPERIPIFTQTRLVNARIVVAPRIQQSVIGVAHGVLAKGVEAVRIMLGRPCDWMSVC